MLNITTPRDHCIRSRNAIYTTPKFSAYAVTKGNFSNFLLLNISQLSQMPRSVTSIFFQKRSKIHHRSARVTKLMPYGSKKREVRKTYFVRSNKQVAISVQVERRWLQSMKLLDCDAISVGWESTQRPLWGVSRQKLMIALLAGHLKIRIRHYIHSMIHGEKSLKDFSWSRKHWSSVRQSFF